MAKSKKGGGIGAVALGLAAAACIAIPGGDKSAKDDYRADAGVADPPAITETIGQQEPQEAVEPKTEVTTQPDAQTPQDTPQTVTQPEAPKQEQPVQQEEFKDEERMVYITPTGEKYHKKGCRTIKGDCTEISINDAIARGYTACGVCGG